MVSPVISKAVKKRLKAKKAKVMQQNACNRMLWKLLAYTGMPMRISMSELENIPENAGVNVVLDGDEFVFTPLNVPEKSNIILDRKIIT